MRIALAQLNPHVGDFEGNARGVERAWRRGASAGADLVITPELSITGYPPKDLLERASFIARCAETVERLAETCREGPALIVGFPERNPQGGGNPLFNAAAVLEGGRVASVHRKSLLPTYDVFDEARHFEPAREVRTAVIRGVKVAVTICEDMWLEDATWSGRRYGHDPVADLLEEGAALIVNISASPWNLGKTGVRVELCRSHAARGGVPIAFCNQTGGFDDLVFDGSSMVILPDGTVAAKAAEFEEDVVLFDLGSGTGDLRPAPEHGELGRVEKALTLGLRDYFRKAGGFKTAVVGLSGGIDSAVVAALAARALGPDNVLGVRMPSRYSSDGSLEDASALAQNLGIRLETLPIKAIYPTFLETLAPVFGDRPFGVAEENLQARIRGALLMAISNKLGHIVLSTGNKSELAVGYCTLYGDMSGGLAIISDLPKMLVYDLARHLNRSQTLIPISTITKPPSAELRPDQKDEDSLPPYPILDQILEAYIEKHLTPDAIAREHALDREVVDHVVRLVDRNEYKRRQAAPGLRVTRKAFGPGRRIPIARHL